ncbi:MAG: cytochrome c oxidase, subunit [Ramlibacter sp.]|uniref:cbb3-type cytochrome c oxidase subunit I n=1 Tax=Ramlibacter sp. TaxID=1917967 RepID=UPI0026374FF4|nr:cbb3-type cytochrome c oxidase subunit I [Ramlibacter sp.]MDB5749815.1 cytochrome c oxidase, subunit [Ramlibacter sp.]
MKLPNSLPRPAGELEALQRAWEPPKGWRAISAVNNDHVGVYYLGTALLFFVLAGMLALLMRAQLALPNAGLVSATTYNQLFTMHGTVMMFLFAVPMVEAVAVYLLPGMLGARDLPFPRLSAYAFWAYAIGGLAFFATVFFGAAPDGGWFMYPPLTGKEHSPGIGADWWLLGIGFIEISAIAGAIELIIGILFTRAPGMGLMKMPLFAWAMLVTAFMIVFAFPAIIAGTILLELERALDWPFFIPARGGDPLLWQHLFWFFGHPEVYIIFLPAAGMVSMMVPVAAQTRLVGYRAIVWALVAVGAISFLLWMHHMFTAGLGPLALYVTSAASFAVAIPSGVQVFAWIATFWRGQVRMTTPSLFLLGFHFIFVLGGLTGVMVAVTPFDWQVHDSYFIVAHLHYVLIGGMVFPLFAGIYHWMPVLNGLRLSERVGRWSFGLMFGGFNLAFFPMHIAGLNGMPRRVVTYDAGLGWSLWNLLSTVGAFVFAAGVALCLLDLVRTMRRPWQKHGDPWHADTLEWLGQEEYGIRSIPQVASRSPLWDRPTLAAEVEAGRHWLPGTVFGGRETLVTSPLRGEIRHLLRLPTDGWSPFVAAAGTAGFFLLLTVAWLVPAFICGAVAIGAMVYWLWGSDQPPPRPTATIGDGVEVPSSASGSASHSWWAMIILLAVDATIFASLAFAHIHLSMALDVCPPPGAALPGGALPASGLLVAGSALLAFAVWRLGRGGQGLLRLALVAALACTLGGIALDFTANARSDLSPTDHAWGASVAAMLAWQGFHALILLLMGTYVLARSWSGALRADARATLDNTALMWHYVSVQGIVAMALVRLLPQWMG